ncbi:MAG: hypothetical protein ACOWWO_04020 [Peptococcaceae bacterium]
MKSFEESQHDLLLIILVALFILFATGLAGPSPINEEPLIIP